MRKLRLDLLNVDSFPTTAIAAARGSVAAQEIFQTKSGCPDSWDGTCWLTCQTCDTGPVFCG